MNYIVLVALLLLSPLATKTQGFEDKELSISEEIVTLAGVVTCGTGIFLKIVSEDSKLQSIEAAKRFNTPGYKARVINNLSMNPSYVHWTPQQIENEADRRIAAEISDSISNHKESKNFKKASSLCFCISSMCLSLSAYTYFQKNQQN